MYHVQYDFVSGVACIVRDSDGACIPQDPRNVDFVAFLAWNAAQPVPLDLSPRPPESPPPVKTPEELAAEFIAIDADPEKRTPFWNALHAVFYLQMAQEQPERMEMLVNESLKIAGQDPRFKIRKDKG